MSRGELLAACRRIAPDFQLEHGAELGRGPRERGRRYVRGICTYRGEVLELVAEKTELFDVERHVLDLCLADLRRRETTKRETAA